MNGPRWIKQWISDMAALNEQFRNDDGLVDFDALCREEYSFRVALITKKFGKSERAMEIYRVAKIAYDSSVENGKKGGLPKKSPQDAPVGNAGDELLRPARVASESATSTAVAKTLNQPSHRKTHGGKVSLKDDAEKFARELKKNPMLRKLHQQMDEQWKVYRHSMLSYGRKS